MKAFKKILTVHKLKPRKTKSNLMKQISNVKWNIRAVIWNFNIPESQINLYLCLQPTI